MHIQTGKSAEVSTGAKVNCADYTCKSNTTVGNGRADISLCALKVAGEARDAAKQTSEHNAADPKLRPASDGIVERRARHRARARDNRVGKRQQQLPLGRLDAEQLVHGGQVVGQDRVAAELRKDGHEGHHGEAPAGIVRVEQRQVVPDAGAPLQLDAGLELAQLELHHRVVHVATAVVLCQDGGRLFLLPPHGQPARRLGHEERADKDERGRDELQAERQPKRRLAGRLDGGVGNTGGEDGAGVEDWDRVSVEQIWKFGLVHEATHKYCSNRQLGHATGEEQAPGHMLAPTTCRWTRQSRGRNAHREGRHRIGRQSGRQRRP